VCLKLKIMNINTKFDINQVVYFITKYGIKQDIITNIDISIRSFKDITIRYYLNANIFSNDTKYFDEEYLFSSKEDLIKSL